MKIILGLGNPGKQYKLNRHNIGFMVVDKVAELYGQGKWTSRFNGLLCECWLDRDKFLLLKPTTFMNNSGLAAMEIIRFYKIELCNLIVFHDDLDISLGEIRLKNDGGHAGHNGVRSIHQYLGSSYNRVRFGIGHPGSKNLVSSYVLSDFKDSEKPVLETILETTQKNIMYLVRDNTKRFLTSFSHSLDIKN